MNPHIGRFRSSFRLLTAVGCLSSAAVFAEFTSAPSDAEPAQNVSRHSRNEVTLSKPETMESLQPKNDSTPAAIPDPIDSASLQSAIRKAFDYLRGKEASGGFSQYSDYVVFCGLPVVAAYPEFEEIIDGYSDWITRNNRFDERFPYWNICHVMALDLIGQREKAIAIFEQVRPLADSGAWSHRKFYTYHLGWYLYGALVAGDADLIESTYSQLLEMIQTRPRKENYFAAWCLWQCYERSQDSRYRETFIALANSLKQYGDDYVLMAQTDGHAGMALSVMCRAFALTDDEEYREIARNIVATLVKSQSENGSWNDKTAYTIMPAEGLAAYLKFCQ